MPIDPEALLAPAAVEAGVAALAERNRHHLEQMDPSEQQDAVKSWRELATTVLAAARSTLEGDAQQAADVEGVPGRAVIVLEDLGEDDVSVHAAFHPELQDLGAGEVAGTPAQIAALSLLNELSDGGDLEGPIETS